MKGPKPLTAAELRRHALPEVSGGDKDSHGAILIIAGSREVPGASLLTATAAMRSGAGKLQLAVPEEIAIPVAIAMPEAMVIGHKSARDGGFSPSGVRTIMDQAGRADTIVAGPGLARSASAARLAKELCALGKPLALDAAMLHELSAQARDARAAEIPPILLPHAGEMASLLGCEPEDVEDDPLAAGTTCANRYDSIVLVKGVVSHIVTPGGQSW